MNRIIASSISKNKMFFIFVFLLMVFVNSQLFAQSPSAPVTTTAVPGLALPVDARAGAMGMTGVASMPDANSPFWNLAKTCYYTKSWAASVNYSPYFKNVNVQNAQNVSFDAFKVLQDNSAISLYGQYQQSGDMQFTDYTGQSIGNGNSTNFFIGLGYARNIISHLSVGVGLKYIYSNLTGQSSGNFYGPGGYTTNIKPANAFAADISLYYSSLTREELIEGLSEDNRYGWSGGFTLQNLGTKVKYSNQSYFLPATMNFGLSFFHLASSNVVFNYIFELDKSLVPALPSNVNPQSMDDYYSTPVAASWIHSFDGAFDLRTSFGLECTIYKWLALRSGYTMETVQSGGRNYFTCGLGLRSKSVAVNFSYMVGVNNGQYTAATAPLSNTFKISLVVDMEDTDYSTYMR